MKNYHDQKIEKHNFMVGDLVILFNSRLCCFRANSSPDGYLITQLFPYGAVELENKEGVRFKVKG